MDIEDLHPGQSVLVETPWGEPTTLVKAKVIAVRRGGDSRAGGFSPRPVTVEWIDPPPFPQGRYPRYSTFDADKIRPVHQTPGRRGMVTLELFA